MLNKIPKRILSLGRPVELPLRLVAMLAATPVSEPKALPEGNRPAPFVHQPADAEIRAWNQRKECEWEAAHARFVHQEADNETRAHNQARERWWFEELARLEVLLREICPAAFRDPPTPLAIGIDRDLVALLRGEFDGAIIGAFLGNWTRRPAYRDAIRRGGLRYDLNGLPSGEVTAREGGRGGAP